MRCHFGDRMREILIGRILREAGPGAGGSLT